LCAADLGHLANHPIAANGDPGQSLPIWKTGALVRRSHQWVKNKAVRRTSGSGISPKTNNALSSRHAVSVSSYAAVYIA
jgi:hypothetical protein